LILITWFKTACTTERTCSSNVYECQR